MTSRSNQLDWHKRISGPHRSARAKDSTGGYYAIHKSGDTEITTYHMYPFYRLGVFENPKEAIEVCQQHYEDKLNG